jgi:tetratricopeptide (TPR) repeat protein
MKQTLLILCILICLVIPAVSADTISASLSSGVGTPETPPENVSFYIADANAAIAGQNWTSALFLTTRGLAWYPDNPDLLCLQSYTYRKMGQYTKSVDVISKAILLDPKAVRYANRGYGYLALGNPAAALADAETGISLDANYTADYGVKALALTNLGRNSEALDAIGQALDRDPANAHYWHVKGSILATPGDCTGAREALEKSLALDPAYALPYPGFGSATDSLAALNTTCPLATTTAPAPTQAASGGIAVIGIIGALLAVGMRK